MRAAIRDRLSLNARAHLAGRAHELAELKQALVQGSAAVIHLHGLPGVGKSALAAAFAEDVRRQGGTALVIECAAVEPTERGLLAELGRQLDCDGHRDVAAALGARPPPVLLLFDGYEVFGLLDAWVRQTLIPSLPDQVLVLLTSRLPPSDAWTEAPAWQDLFRTMPLGPLPDSAAIELLTRLDVPEPDLVPILAFAAGHPLALTLAARAARLPASERAAAAPAEAAIPQLARRYLTGIPEADLREALRAACVARRISRGLLRTLFPQADADDLYAKLASLPFVSAARDGLAVHEAVREALAADLLAADPERHRQFRQQAWRYLSQESRNAPFGELWRCTADLIHLVHNPVVREAFFPRNAQRLNVEPAQAEDRQAILNIAERHDGSGAAMIELWWDALPHAVFVARAPDRSVEGFYCLLDAAAATAASAAVSRDPVVAGFVDDLRANRLPGQQTALFLRRWLDRQEGDRPSAVQAACWLDVKRHYMERRPRLRRVYLAVADFTPHAAVAGKLGFVPLPAPATAANRVMQTAVLDMGPGSVDGWLLRLAAEELGIAPAAGVLDHAKRALRVDGMLVPLTRREFDVMAYLAAREGDAVSRDSLIQDVWGLRIDPGSNVVDAVVASLRRKLRGRAGVIETARGFGYVFRADPGPSASA